MRILPQILKSDYKNSTETTFDFFFCFEALCFAKMDGPPKRVGFDALLREFFSQPEYENVAGEVNDSASLREDLWLDGEKKRRRPICFKTKSKNFFFFFFFFFF